MVLFQPGYRHNPDLQYKHFPHSVFWVTFDISKSRTRLRGVKWLSPSHIVELLGLRITLVGNGIWKRTESTVEERGEGHSKLLPGTCPVAPICYVSGCCLLQTGSQFIQDTHHTQAPPVPPAPVVTSSGPLVETSSALEAWGAS